MSAGQHDSGKLLGSNLRWNPLFCEFHRREDHLILTIKIQQISPFGTNRRRRSIIIMKYAQSTLHKKGLLSRGKDFIRVLAQQRERHCSHQTMLEPSCFANVWELCKGHLKMTVQRHRPTERLRSSYKATGCLASLRPCLNNRTPVLTVNYSCKAQTLY